MNLRFHTKELVAKEKHYTSLILKNLAIIDKQKLYCDYGFESLYKYLINELKYSDSEANIRVAAVKLANKSPQVFKKIKTGELNLTNAAEIYRSFELYKREHKKTASQKQINEAITSSVRKPTRRVREDLRTKLKLKAPQSETINLDHRICAKIERARAIYGDISAYELFDTLLEEKLRTPSKPLRRRKNVGVDLVHLRKRKNTDADLAHLRKLGTASFSTTVAATKQVRAGDAVMTKNNTNESSVHLRKRSVAVKKSRYIPVEVKYATHKGKCQNCKSTRNLEYDHIVPFSKGGTNIAANIQLLCFSCNQRKRVLQTGST